MTNYLIGYSLCALLCTNAVAANSPAPPAAANGLPQMGQFYVEEFRKPEYAASRCMLALNFASDGTTVASTDRVFSAGDVVIAIGDQQIDANSKTTVSDLLMKHGPDETIPIKIRRADKEMVVTAKCADAKPLYDLLLDAAYAASKNDAATCADKMSAAGRLHALPYMQMWLGYSCGRQAGRIVTTTDVAQGYYELQRELILEAGWSSDALGRIRETILSAVHSLQTNNAAMLANDLIEQYEQAVSAASPQPLNAPSK
ncbi:MAG: hypothetical protein ACLQFT_09140 [Steroidobacteraceae bacterium]|jgi:hypothetical protein